MGVPLSQVQCQCRLPRTFMSDLQAGEGVAGKDGRRVSGNRK